MTALTICTTAHYVIAAVMALLARHQVKYLSIAWIMGLFAAMLNVALVLVFFVSPEMPTTLPPASLLILVISCFLQSIYPLSIPMPAYLQWERMWRYATPAIVLIVVWLLMLALGIQPGWVLRVACIALSLYYIINMLRLPRRLAHAVVPTYIKAYSSLVGLNALFFVVVTFLPYSTVLCITSVVVFTLLNLYLCFRVLETMAIEIPKPQPVAVEHEPQAEEIAKVEDDFNEANQKRFERVEHWMQHNPERWRDNTFGRDQLCRETGLNRHLLLQCVRSAGYYNSHEYINSYRVKEVKRMVETGQASNLTECLIAGFGTIKTLRSSFQRETGQSIDEYLTGRKK